MRTVREHTLHGLRNATLSQQLSYPLPFMCLAAVADVFNSESVICRFEETSAPRMQQRGHSIDPSNPHTMPASITCASLHCHPLEKKSKVYTGRYQCDVCKGGGTGWVFHCPECSWDAHPRCVAETLNSSSALPLSLPAAAAGS